MSDPSSENWLTTVPGTQFELSVRARSGPCWRCRFHLRWPPWRKHWQCRKLSPITNWVD